MELDSLNDTYLKKRHKKKKKKRKKRVGGADASETASEIRSTTCTSTTPTESRDVRRSGLESGDLVHTHYYALYYDQFELTNEICQ